ncbi:MAG: hypothetical protein R2861_07560 [Desulfobacterales bacterium]
MDQLGLKLSAPSGYAERAVVKGVHFVDIKDAEIRWNVLGPIARPERMSWHCWILPPPVEGRATMLDGGPAGSAAVTTVPFTVGGGISGCGVR